MTSVTTHTLATPDGRLYYELRGGGPLLAITGSPMHSAPFTAVAEQLATDYTVLTHDPRGHFGSPLDDPETDATPERRADDLARLIRHLDLGRAVVLGSSGGAITALALVQSDPELVQTAITHEPPLAELLDDRDQLRAERADTIATFRGGDRIGAIRKFIASTGMPISEEAFDQMFGGEPTPADLANDRFFYLHELGPTGAWKPDLDALRAARGRLIIGIGEASADQFCERTSQTLAAALNLEPTLFPGGHVGFIEDPVKFAARLREVVS